MSDTHSPTPAASGDHSHGDHAGDHGHHDLKKHIRLYLIIGGILIFMTFFTIAVAYMPIFDFGDKHINIGFGLLIAAFKVSLVCLIFMHLNHERGLIYKVMLFSMVFFAAMMFLFCLAYMDPIQDSFLKQ
jgi:caa(3)-type oxidase subunit IV